jgi:hypothetical protein
VTTPVRGEFLQSSARPKLRSVPLSHLSIELGHLYLEDFQAGPERVERLLADVAPWARAAASSVRVPRGKPRVSTCFLVDDYFSQLTGPDEVVPQVLAAAERAGLTIDYLARESACARVTGPAGDVSPAELLVSQLVPEPEPGTNGGRPPAQQSGWLANGRRSPSPTASAMEVRAWQPPEQNAKRRHSVFVDVELWDDAGSRRTWSCPLLAAAWQLLRLGLLRHGGSPLVEEAEPPETWPATWSALPAVVKLNRTAAPFAAYSTVSILSPRFLPVELAVRTILGQTRLDPAVAAQLAERAGAEGVELAEETVDRIGYVFAGAGVVDPP